MTGASGESSKARMQAYCTSCFRDLPSEDTPCRCRGVSAASTSSIVVGLLVFAVIMTGVLTLDARLCIVGAAIGVVALGFAGRASLSSRAG